MSAFELMLQTANQMTVNYDLTKIFLRNNRSRVDNFDNATGGDLELKPGTLLGRVTATNKLALCASGAGDGSEIPVGILMDEIDILDTENADVNYVYFGDVAEDQVILDGVDTLETMVNGRSIRDRIAADTAGIFLVTADELTEFDN